MELFNRMDWEPTIMIISLQKNIFISYKNTLTCGLLRGKGEKIEEIHFNVFIHLSQHCPKLEVLQLKV